MGFESSDAKFLLSAYKLGFHGDSVLTLGRQTLFMTPGDVNRLLREYGFAPATIPSDGGIYYADRFFRALGFRQVESMDASPYEGASVVHDLNAPVPPALHGRYDLVWDGGTLEHVFNYPVALSNAMRMLKSGGHLILVTPANNQCGHGFYQFSPELFFRVLVPENGFELLRMYITGRGGPYHVVDPALVGQRVELLSGDAAMLMVHARKLEDRPIFATAPQQSDYVTAWSGSMRRDGAIKSFLRRTLSPEQITAISTVLNQYRQRRAVRQWRKLSKLANRRFYVPVGRWDVTSREELASTQRERSA